MTTPEHLDSSATSTTRSASTSSGTAFAATTGASRGPQLLQAFPRTARHLANVSASRHVPPGYVIIHPNRELRSSHVARAVVVAILLLSVAMILAITLGGWSQLDGMTPVSFAWCIAYVAIAYYVWRWARGLLPIAAALGMLLLVPAIVSLAGFYVTSWSQRAGTGYGQIHSVFGGSFSPHLLSLLTILLIPVQLGLIAACVATFMQGWQLELEVPESEVKQALPRG